MDISRLNCLKSWYLKRRYALLSNIFPIVLVAEYGCDVSSQTVLIVSHQASILSNDTRSGFHVTCLSFTGCIALHTLHRYSTELVSWIIFGTFWVSAKYITLKNIMKTFLNRGDSADSSSSSKSKLSLTGRLPLSLLSDSILSGMVFCSYLSPRLSSLVSIYCLTWS